MIVWIITYIIVLLIYYSNILLHQKPESMLVSLIRASIISGHMNWNPCSDMLTMPSSNLLSNFMRMKSNLDPCDSGLYFPVLETTFRFLMLYTEPSSKRFLNRETRIFGIVAWIKFSCHTTYLRKVNNIIQFDKLISYKYIDLLTFSSIKIMSRLISSSVFGLTDSHILHTRTLIIQV